jgi:ubiquinone/menaquinone biosynthesis C-methylase UbiE
MTEWYERAFDESYLEVYDQFEEESIWQRDCDFITRQLGLQPGDSVLDLCCGAGRHSLELARRGLQVCGLDASQSLIAKCIARAADEELEVKWICQDARDMDFDAVFDAAYNYLTSFGLCNEEGNRLILDNVFRALRPGGRFLIEMINFLWLFGNFVPTERRVYEGFTYIERRRYDARTGCITTTREKVSKTEGTQELEPFKVHAYTPCEIVALLEGAGFEVGDFVASPTGQAFQTFSTPRMGIIARRPE